MEIAFVAILLGCSDDLGACDEVGRSDLLAVSEDACSEMVLSRDEILRIDYPSVIVECRPAAQATDQLIADAS